MIGVTKILIIFASSNKTRTNNNVPNNREIYWCMYRVR